MLTGLRWFRLAAAILLYMALDVCARLGARLAKRALRLDLCIDRWRHELQRRPWDVDRIVGQVNYAVRHGATSGQSEYKFLDDGDMELLARAIDNLGCYAQVWPRRLQWRRRDMHCTGDHLSLAAFAPADRDAWADAIANLDGEAEG